MSSVSTALTDATRRVSEPPVPVSELDQFKANDHDGFA